MQDPHPGGSVRIRHALAGAACCTAESAEVPDRAALYHPRRRPWRHQAVAWRPRLWMARRQEAALCQEHRRPLWLRPEHRRFADRKRRRDSRMRRRQARSRSGRHPRGPPIRPKPPRPQVVRQTTSRSTRSQPATTWSRSAAPRPFLPASPLSRQPAASVSARPATPASARPATPRVGSTGNACVGSTGNACVTAEACSDTPPTSVGKASVCSKSAGIASAFGRCRVIS